MRIEAKPKKVAIKLPNNEIVEAHAECWILALLETLPTSQAVELAKKAASIEEGLQKRRNSIFLPDGSMPIGQRL